MDSLINIVEITGLLNGIKIISLKLWVSISLPLQESWLAPTGLETSKILQFQSPEELSWPKSYPVLSICLYLFYMLAELIESLCLEMTLWLVIL
jgi:hypothetical protein